MHILSRLTQSINSNAFNKTENTKKWGEKEKRKTERLREMGEDNFHKNIINSLECLF